MSPRRDLIVTEGPLTADEADWKTQSRDRQPSLWIDLSNEDQTASSSMAKPPTKKTARSAGIIKIARVTVTARPTTSVVIHPRLGPSSHPELEMRPVVKKGCAIMFVLPLGANRD